MGVRNDLWALRTVYGRSEQFMGAQNDLWAFGMIYGRSE